MNNTNEIVETTFDNRTSMFEEEFSRFEKLNFDGKQVLIPPPDQPPPNYQLVGRETEMEDLVSALNANLHPIIISDAGQGKTTACHQAAVTLERDLYIINGHEDLDAEQLLVELLPSDSESGFEFVIQPLLAAILRGGLACIDEINRLSEPAIASLHSLLDGRNCVSSSLLGMHFQAHPDFRLFGLANPFTSTLTQAADQRLRPVFHWSNYNATEVIKIVSEVDRFGCPEIENAYRKEICKLDHEISLRSALTVLRFAKSLYERNRDKRGYSATECVTKALQTGVTASFCKSKHE